MLLGSNAQSSGSASGALKSLVGKLSPNQEVTLWATFGDGKHGMPVSVSNVNGKLRITDPETGKRMSAGTFSAFSFMSPRAN